MQPATDSLRQLFQQEYSRMVAVISRKFGLAHIEMAEDIVAGTFLQAAESWGIHGIPENPAAWLYTVAKNKILHQFRREKIFNEKIKPVLRTGEPFEETDMDFSGENIRDSQLRMIFAVCHPVIAAEAQIGLALRILCGFGIDEISEAFLAGKDTVNKRLFRAREKLREEKIGMEMPEPAELDRRMDSVLRVIYLLFNEGYYSSTQNHALRKDLCVEAVRLGSFLTEFPATDQPQTNALMALMCYHSSRLGARESGNGEYILYEDQDELKWDYSLIEKGNHFLNAAATGSEVSLYHLEAGIAYWHCVRTDSRQKWNSILDLYDLLLAINPSPAVRLNRIFALYKAKGAAEAIAATGSPGIRHDHFYYILLGELYRGSDSPLALQHFRQALDLARTDTDKMTIQKRIDAVRAGS